MFEDNHQLTLLVISDVRGDFFRLDALLTELKREQVLPHAVLVVGGLTCGDPTHFNEDEHVIDTLAQYSSVARILPRFAPTVLVVYGASDPSVTLRRMQTQDTLHSALMSGHISEFSMIFDVSLCAVRLAPFLVVVGASGAAGTPPVHDYKPALIDSPIDATPVHSGLCRDSQLDLPITVGSKNIPRLCTTPEPVLNDPHPIRDPYPPYPFGPFTSPYQLVECLHNSAKYTHEMNTHTFYVQAVRAYQQVLEQVAQKVSFDNSTTSSGTWKLTPDSMMVALLRFSLATEELSREERHAIRQYGPAFGISAERIHELLPDQRDDILGGVVKESILPPSQRFDASSPIQNDLRDHIPTIHPPLSYPVLDSMGKTVDFLQIYRKKVSLANEFAPIHERNTTVIVSNGAVVETPLDQETIGAFHRQLISRPGQLILAANVCTLSSIFIDKPRPGWKKAYEAVETLRRYDRERDSLILLTHQGPAGTSTTWDSTRDVETGSEGLRSLAKTMPRVIAHLHGRTHTPRATKDMLDDTLVFNPGSLQGGCYGLISLERDGARWVITDASTHQLRLS
ncbi:hypothetical protein GMRT_13783 [Giardia muris]|uniref:Uncharacterized protein n=1 Tax=Giardia muris TaxID=5742 RepID=A0A4Z1SS71_GIAMU|nr:hypothetical protein GMRT_13783 [Giardia muris]|eukprot:TNJ28746.1 hypothetical protein GMRT_13783 [Giardia muris]